jgi:hypothetical protein
MNTKHTLLVTIALLGCACVGLWQIDADKKHPKRPKNPTPTDTIIAALAAPRLSLATGFYANDDALRIAVLDTLPPHAQVYYTTDGSPPTRRALRYTRPLRLHALVRQQWTDKRISYLPTSPIYKLPTHPPFRGVCLRVAIYTPQHGFGRTTTAHYFLHPTQRTQPYPCAVVCIATDPKNLFDAQKGIYVLGEKYFNNDQLTQERMDMPDWLYYKLPANYMQRGKKWQKSADITFIDDKNNMIFNEDVQIKIKGNASRALPQKSITIKLKNDQLLRHRIFDGLPQHWACSQLLLRNASGDFTHTMLRDEFIQTLLKNTSLLTIAYLPAVVFINAEYWGLHNVREELSPQNIALKLNTDAKNIQMAEIRDQKFNANNDKIIQNLNYYEKITRDTTLSPQVFYEIIDKNFDINNLIEYCIIQTYCANTDWLANNVNMYKNGDDKWRFIVYDTDFGLGGDGNPDEYRIDMYNFIQRTPYFFSCFIRRLMQNEAFRQAYWSKYKTMQKNNFDTVQMLQTFGQMQQRIAPLMPEHTARWGYPENWGVELQIVKKFIQKRAPYDQAHLQKLLKDQAQKVIEK